MQATMPYHVLDGLSHSGICDDSTQRTELQALYLAALTEDGAREHSSRCRAIPRLVIGLGGHLPHQLRAHVLELVLQ